MKRVLSLILFLCILIIVTGCAKKNEIFLSGTVEYTQYDVNAEAAGKITSIALKEGEPVKAGDVIASIDSSLQETGVQQAQALVKAKELRLKELASGSREEQIGQAEAAVKAAQAQYDDIKKGASTNEINQAKASANVAADNEQTAKTAYDYAKAKYDEALTAYNFGLLAKDKLDEAKFNKDTAQSKYNAAKHQHDAATAQLKQLQKGASAGAKEAALAGVEQAQAQLDLLKNGSAQYTVDMAEADLDAANAQLAQTKLQQSKCSIVSPVAGTLSIVQIALGDMVNTGGYAATVIDENDLWTHVYIPQTGLKYVSVNDAVTLTTTAWPGISFKGTIETIADKAQFTPKNIETREAKENTVFKIKIKIEDPEHKLKPGMTIDAHIAASERG
jgi:HlyD family secretion protein